MQAADRKLTRGDLLSSFWRYLMSFQISWNYERMQALGFCYAMVPILKRLFPSRDELAAALKRHLAFFNTNPVVGAPLILGSAAAMEEAGAPASAEGVKVSLMGPLAGVGDTLVWALYNSIIFTIGASLALQGSMAGPILVIFLVAVPYTLVRYWQFMWAYAQGRQLATSLAGGTIARLTEGAMILGLIVLGGFIPSIIAAKTPLTYTQTVTVAGQVVKQTVEVQKQLDAILPGLIPVVFTALAYWLLKRYKMNPLWVILILFVIGMVFGALGWLA